MLTVDKEFYDKIAEAQGRTLSDLLRDALTAYRVLETLPLMVTLKSLPELRGELVQAYEAGVFRSGPTPPLNEGEKPTKKSRGRRGAPASK